MWKTVYRRARRALKPFRTLLPHRFAKNIDAEAFGWFNWDTGELVPGFPICGEDTVVDVGCGEGSASEFAAHFGAAVFAVDIDPEAIDRVTRRMKGMAVPRPFHVLRSDGDPLPLDDGIATRIVCQEVMEHVDAPQRFLAELVRIGRPGALYLLSVPDPVTESLQKELAPPAYWQKPNHLRVFQREEFDRLVTDSGLVIEKRAHFSFFWSMWWILFWSSKNNGPAGAPATPVLKHWNNTWAALMKAPNGACVKQALDNFMPKIQMCIARKPA
jgi:SAM-dependent methyltransferase